MEGADVKDRQLHVFCDASEEAYATAVYWRLKDAEGNVKVSLAAAKARVAPIRSQSIPRLELQAALIGARLAQTVRDEQRWQPNKTVYWSDSETTLKWIKNDNLKLKPYVAHRVTEILELTNQEDWCWVPTAENVADDATRLNHENKNGNDRWFVGPDFLYQSEESWPKKTIKEESIEAVMHIDIKETSLPDISRFSNYERLVRATAYVFLFIEACRGRRKGLRVRHLRRAEDEWVRQAQRESFRAEIDQLRKNDVISRDSKLWKLDPQLDADGIMRLGGRIGAAEIEEERKRPVILDGRHPYTRLLVIREHEKAGHANNERVVNDLRQRYWVTRIRPAVRQASRECIRCRVRRAKPAVPPHGDLPSARLKPYTRPFTYVGVDYFGPLVVTVGRRHEKRWGALFTCMTTRAVHMEVAHSLSTESAIMALRRMAARRGWPVKIYSDNGTNFRGADTELREAYKKWLPDLREYSMTRRTDWVFIPPGAPNQGGVWERLVRSIKVALSAALNEKYPKDEVLQTVMTEAEHAVNGRPLTHVPVSRDDPEALTPNHFLIGSSSGLPVVGPCEHAGRQTWRTSQAIADEFWRRWIKEYLPTLAPRGNSQNKTINVEPGDLVVIMDSNLPRNVWPRGVIETVHPGPDGRVRSADVRTQGGVFRRPVRKLAVLRVEGAPKVFAGGRMLRTESLPATDS